MLGWTLAAGPSLGGQRDLCVEEGSRDEIGSGTLVLCPTWAAQVKLPSLSDKEKQNALNEVEA